MTDREKLTKLIDETVEISPAESCAIADHLIANGVTVQRWIPVTERLPENSDDVIVCHKNGWVTTNAWLVGSWWYKNEVNPITHWMPLPEPPADMRKESKA